MPLHQIKDFDPNYQQHFDDRDILKFDVYSGNEKVGSVDDLLVDDAGQFRYFVINTGAWIVGKKVLVPVGRARIDDSDRRVYIDGLTRDQVKSLPEYKGDPVDYDYEERVRGVYRPTVATRGTTPVATPYDRNSYRYDRDPALYNLNDREHASLKHSEARMMSGRPITGKHRRSVGVFPNRQAAEHAMHELRDSGFPMGRVSIITRDADKHDDDIAGAEVRDRVGNKADEGATLGAVSGGVLGGLTGLLVGLGTLAIPGIGPIMLAGATATTLATTLAGGAIGAVSGGLLGALIGLGIPEERARVYEDRIARGGYLVIVDGTDEDIARAEAILHRRGIEEYGVYDAPGATAATPVSTMPAPGTTPVGRRSAVGFFPNLADAEHAIADLRGIGFPLSQITLVANNLQRRDRFAGIDLRDRFEAARLGIPAEQARLYHDRLGRGEHMVIVHGTEDELNRAAPILNRRGIQEWRIYDPTAVHNEVPVAAPMGTAAMRRRSAVGFFPNLSDAEQAITDLRSAGFPLGQITLVANNLQRRERFAGIDLRDRFEAARLGIPAEQERLYHDRLGRGEYMVIVHGSEDELNCAAPILNRRGIQGWRMYDPTDISTGAPMSNRGHQHAVGFFPHRRDAEQAIADLRNVGFPLGQISLVAQRFDQREPFAGVNLLDRFDNSRFGFPEDRARSFNNRIGRGDYLVIVHGTPEHLRQAEAILNRAHIDDFGIYDTSGMAPDHPTYEQVNRTGMPTTATPVTAASAANRVGMQRKRAMGLFSQRRDAEVALTELRDAGFPMDRVSLIGKQTGDNDRIAGVDMRSQAGNKADEGAKAGAATGGALGGLGGLLIGLGTLAIPGIGPVLLGGAAATAIATTLAGGAIGAAAGGLTGALVGLGIPEDRARVYNDRVSHGDYLVIIDGTEAETRQAESILRRHDIHEWGLYDAADVDATRTSQASVERPLAADVDPALRDRDPRIEQPNPNVVIVDRRDETRL